ncbi:MAG: hypothetical protein ABI597_12655 [Gammaproteobacteria bacterium]
MTKSQAKDLFQLQTELVDMKVDMAVSKAIERVIDQLTDLKIDMNKRFSHLEKHFSSVEHRVMAVESTLGKMSNTQNEIRTKFIDYSFRAGWVLLLGVVSFVIVQFHSLIQAILK